MGLLKKLGSLFLSVFGFYFSYAMMKALQTPSDILKDAVLYLRVYFIGFPFLFMYNILSTMFTSIGESKIPLGRVENVFSLIFVSIGNAVSPYVSQNLGAKKMRRIREGYHAALLLDEAFPGE